MKKAFSTLEIKSVEQKNGKRVFKGIASTPTPDREEDIVEPEGATYSLPLPFLWQHDDKDPIGWITKVKASKQQIEVEGEVANVEEEGTLKEHLNYVWGQLKIKLVRGLSIGFRILESAKIEGSNWGRRITKWEWMELSAVTIACNQEATITNIKTAFGLQNPGVSGKQNQGSNMKTLQEQLQELKTARATKAARLNELTESIKTKSQTPEDTQEFDSLVEEIDQLDNEIRVKNAECINASTSKAVTPKVKTAPRFNINKGTDKDEDFKGQNFTRMVIAKAVAMQQNISPVAVAQKRWGRTNPMLVNVIKAAVEGGGTGSGEWGSELLATDAKYTGDFIEYLHEKTIFDQLSLTEVPANVTIKGQDGAATGYWVGESAAIPASAQSFSDVTLTPLKVAALAVISNELIQSSAPSAEKLVRNALVNASAQKVDSTFFSTSAAVSGISPAGILNGLSGKSASGTTADDLRADIKTLVDDFITAKNIKDLEIVMNPSLANAIGSLYSALGVAEFPDITINGGKLRNFPVYTGDNIATDDLIMMKTSDIYKIGDSGVQISMSREATIEMDSAPAMDSQAPTGPTGATVGMFQTESTAIKVVRPINFQVRRTASSVVAFIDDAAYDNSGS